MSPDPSEYGPISQVLAFREYIPPPPIAETLCVHVHLFYPDMAGQFVVILNRIEVKFTLLVSISAPQSEQYWKDFWYDAVFNATTVVVKVVENRGRDVSPWIVAFSEEIQAHDLFCHMHTKRSPYSGAHSHWFRMLIHAVCGSRGTVNQILSLFHRDANVGLVFPAYAPFLSHQPNYGETKGIFLRLLRDMGSDLTFDFCPDFPAGSFFWARTRLLPPLFQLKLEYRDFDPEAGQNCGTLAHGIERIMGALPRLTGMTSEIIAVDVPHEMAADVYVEGNGLKTLLCSSDSLCEQPTAQELQTAWGLVSQERLSISVIVPTWNRCNSIGPAIDSILVQTYPATEILIVDDGSEDGTAEFLMDQYAPSVRNGFIKIIKTDHGGVSAARNIGLSLSTGDIIAYLDSDNIWLKDYLLLVTATYSHMPEVASVYTGLVHIDEDEGIRTIVAKPYNRALLLSTNFIDLNVFSHRRDITEESKRFDEKLNRLVDWDFIIRVTKDAPPIFVPYIGAQYFLSTKRLANITKSVAIAGNLERIRKKNHAESIYFGAEKLRVAIKCPVPSPSEAASWGDYHFGRSLAAALIRQGFEVRLDILPDWYGPQTMHDDVAIVLRGLSRYETLPHQMNIMWHISHPDKVPFEEFELYDHVFVASVSYAQDLRRKHKITKISALLQCADPLVFYPPDMAQPGPRFDVLFVGNSRGVRRWMPAACCREDIPLSVFGSGWDGILQGDTVKGSHIPNSELFEYYGRAGVVLNDHWPDMAKRGFISNRIFDAGLCGAVVVSDDFVGHGIFGDSIEICRNDSELKQAIEKIQRDPEEGRIRGLRLRDIVLQRHTFDHRASEISRIIKDRAFQNLVIPTEIPVLQSDVRPTPPRGASSDEPWIASRSAKS